MTTKLVSALAALLVRLLYASLRVRHVRVENMQRTPQYIMAFWHAHVLLMVHARFTLPLTALISQSRDGELIARVGKWYGVESARGSSTRGGSAAVRELIRHARAGRNITLTPDGPKGPARIAKDGVVYAAQATRLPIAPVAFAAKKKSSSAPGIAWSSRGPSRKRFSCMARQLPSHAMVTSKSGAPASSTR